MPDIPCLEMLHDELAVIVDSVIVDLVDDAYQIVCTAELLDIALPDRLHKLIPILARRLLVCNGALSTYTSVEEVPRYVDLPVRTAGCEGKKLVFLAIRRLVLGYVVWISD